jgi:mRNA interferase HigB
MVIISYKTIREYGEKRIEAFEALDNWYTIVEKADFANFAELRAVFNSVDSVGDDLYVFNIKGNHYRLIVRIHFNVRRYT